MNDAYNRKYHKSYKEFFTPEECEHVISVFEKDKDIVPRGENTGYEGLTSTYPVYNWLYNPALQDLQIEQRLFNLPEFKQWEYMILQCWGNKLPVGKGLGKHYHGNLMDDNDSDLRRQMFYSANIFLGGEYNLTWYEDYGIKENAVGDVHIFTCDLDHEVYENTGTDPRYSMAIDIYPEWQGLEVNTCRFKTAKNQYTQYTHTAQMRFYCARCLSAIDFHNQSIMDENKKPDNGDPKVIDFHMGMRQRLIDYMTTYKDYIHEVEQTNRDYGDKFLYPDLPMGNINKSKY